MPRSNTEISHLCTTDNVDEQHSSSKHLNPYPGLRPFEEEDSALFFGRVQHISDLLERLRSNRFLAVIGVSGSGKSSLIRAGLIPVLRQGFLTAAADRWRTVLFRPGNAPVKALATALDKSFGETCNAEQALEDRCGGLLEVTNRLLDLRENLLVVVDQFEEIFRYKHLTQDEDPDERTNAVAEASALISLLLNGLEDDRVHVIITMRSEYLGDCAQFHGLPEEINKGQYLIPRLSPDQQREIIVRPAWVRHVQISELLVQSLLDDVGPEPEQLPVLQHVLSQVWKDWENLGSVGAISVKNLENVGGFNKAMDRHAEDVYKGLRSPESQWVTKRLFQRITLQGISEKPIRRAQTLADVRSVISDVGTEADADRILREVIKRMRDEDVEFLTSPEAGELRDESVIDISHESLCWLWTRLKNWIDEEEESADLYSRVSKLAILYSKNRKQQGLYTDPGLTYVLKTYRPSHPSSLDSEKIDPWSEAWSKAYNKQWKETKDYLDSSKIRKKLKTASFVGMYGLIALCVMLAMALFFITVGKRADDLASQADFQRAQLGASTQERAALLDIKSRAIQARPSNSDLASWESFDRIVRGTPIGHLSGPVTNLFVTRDDHIVAVIDPKNWQSVPRPVAFKPDESTEDTSFLSNISDLSAISPSGRYAATACREGHAIIWDTATSSRTHFQAECTSSFASIVEPSKSLDDMATYHRIAAVENLEGLNASIRVLDADHNGSLLDTISEIPLMRAVMSPDGRFLAIARKTTSGPVIEIRNLSTHRQVQHPIEGVSESAPLAFSHSGNLLAIGMANGQITLVDFRENVADVRVLQVDWHASERKLYPISAIAFSNGAKPQLLAYAEDGYQNVVRVVEMEREGSNSKAHLLWSDYFGRRAGQLVFSPDDTYLGLALDEDTARIKVAVTGFETARTTHKGRVLSIGFDPHSAFAFSGSDNGELLRFPLVNAKSTDIAEYACPNPQEVSIDDTGDIAAVSCVEADPNDVSSVTPSVRLFTLNVSTSGHAHVELNNLVKVKGLSFSKMTNTGTLCHASLSANGHRVATECNARIEVVDLSTKDRWKVPAGDFQAGDNKLHDGCQNKPISLALNADGSYLAVGDDCGRVMTYDVDQLSRSKSTIASTAPIDLEGQMLFLHSSSTAPSSVTILLDERKRGALDKIKDYFRRIPPVALETQQTNSPPKTTWSITSLAFSPDKQTLSVGTDSGKLWVEDVSNNPKPRWALQLDGTISAAQFSADSNKLIVAAGSAAYIFNAADGESLRHISQQGDTFAAVTFASDGKLAAAGTLKGTVNILDLSTPSPAKLAERFENWLSSATPAADAKISGLQSVYALQFPREGSVNRRLSATPVLAVWTNNGRLLAPADEQERDKTLALEHHDFNVDGRIIGICSGLRQDLTVPPDLDYRSACH